MYELYKMVKNSLKQLKFISKTKTIYKHRTYLTKKQLQDIHNDYHNGFKKKELQKKYSRMFGVSEKTIARKVADFDNADGSISIAFRKVKTGIKRSYYHKKFTYNILKYNIIITLYSIILK